MTLKFYAVNMLYVISYYHFMLSYVIPMLYHTNTVNPFFKYKKLYQNPTT